MKFYSLNFTLLLLSCACSPKENTVWVSVSSIKDLPKYGHLMPSGKIESVAFQICNNNTIIVRANASFEYYEKLNKSFNANSGPVMHYEFSRIINGPAEGLLIEGSNVWVFEGSNLPERKSMTFFFLSDQTVSCNFTGEQLGGLVIVFVN